mgnify:CR=1 FL=1
MKHQNVSAMARANGVSTATAHNRIARGWTTEAATSTPTRKYVSAKRNPKKKTKPRGGRKADAVWAQLTRTPLASYADVAKATGVSYSYAYHLMQKVGTPRNVFEREERDRVHAQQQRAVASLVDDSSTKLSAASIAFGFVIASAVLAAAILALT